MDMLLEIRAGAPLEAHLHTPEGVQTFRATALGSEPTVTAEALKVLDQSQDPGQLMRHADVVGNWLGSQLPESLKASLLSHPRGARLKLKAPFEVPWELASLGEDFLLSRFNLERVVSSVADDWSVASAPVQRATLVLNLEGESGPSTEPLIQALRGFEVLVRTGSDADAEALRTALGQGSGLVLVHAHTEPDGSVGLGDEHASLDHLLSTPVPARPRLVILHLTGNPGAIWTRAGRWAQRLHAEGVDTVLAGLWSLPWRPGATFLTEVLEAMRRGHTLGEGVHHARHELELGWNALPWVVFGNGHLKLNELYPRTSQLAQTREASLRPALQLTVLEGPRAGRKVPIFPSVLQRGQPLTVGGPGPYDNDVDLEDDEAPCRAFSLESSWEGLYLAPAPAARIQLNGLGITARHRLQGGELIQLGTTVLRLEVMRAGQLLPAAPAEPSAPVERRGGRFWLEVSRGVTEDQSARILLDRTTTLLGRAHEADLSLHESTVSRRHCLIVRWQGQNLIRPLSAALTLVNGVPVSEERELHHGDRIQLGECTELLFVDAKKAAEEAQPAGH
ncbi:MAG: FHA domain-containing protein [Candidatus Eremiobacterota bacterium]